MQENLLAHLCATENLAEFIADNLDRKKHRL